MIVLMGLDGAAFLSDAVAEANSLWLIRNEDCCRSMCSKRPI
jgi:hypothetical protein